MERRKIAIIGGGNLGKSIARGLIKSSIIENRNLTVTRRRVHLLDDLKHEGITVSDNNREATEKSDILILAVKPYQVFGVIDEIKPVLSPDKIVISLVTGVRLDKLEKAVGESIPVFRAMPNTAISIQQSMTCISANNHSEKHIAVVTGLFNQLGETVIINEELMSAATVLGSCGIAFAMRFMRAAMQGGIEIGFGADLARFITAQTVKGASELMLSSGKHPEQEIDKVTTPRGVTITGLNEMEHKGFSSSLIQGLVSSFNKIENNK